jgi:hypothetical protein
MLGSLNRIREVVIVDNSCVDVSLYIELEPLGLV